MSASNLQPPVLVLVLVSLSLHLLQLSHCLLRQACVTAHSEAGISNAMCATFAIDSPSSAALSTGAVVAASLGSVVAAGLVVLAFFELRRRHRGTTYTAI